MDIYLLHSNCFQYFLSAAAKSKLQKSKQKQCNSKYYLECMNNYLQISASCPLCPFTMYSWPDKHVSSQICGVCCSFSVIFSVILVILQFHSHNTKTKTISAIFFHFSAVYFHYFTKVLHLIFNDKLTSKQVDKFHQMKDDSIGEFLMFLCAVKYIGCR